MKTETTGAREDRLIRLHQITALLDDLTAMANPEELHLITESGWKGLNRLLEEMNAELGALTELEKEGG